MAKKDHLTKKIEQKCIAKVYSKEKRPLKVSIDLVDSEETLKVAIDSVGIFDVSHKRSLEVTMDLVVSKERLKVAIDLVYLMRDEEKRRRKRKMGVGDQVYIGTLGRSDRYC